MTVVQFRSLDDFIAELREEATRVADRIVRFEVNRTPEQEEQITFEVDAWATALLKSQIADGHDEDYLLEFGEKMGTDDTQADETLEHCEKQAGTKAASAARNRLAEACDDLTLKLRAGKIEVF